jgi:hypothetical protein
MALVTDAVAVAVSTRGDSHRIDLTPGVQELVDRHRFPGGAPRQRQVVVQLSGEREARGGARAGR